MTKTIIKVEGMMCGKCEEHVNKSVGAVEGVKKVTSSHAKGETEVISENAPDEALLRAAVEKAGYKPISVTSEPYEKKGFSLFGKK